MDFKNETCFRLRHGGAMTSTQEEKTKKLQGKSAIVTGAASGIGKAMVQEFLEEGAEVLAVDLQEALLEEIPKSPNLFSLVSDCSLTEDVQKMVDSAASHFGKLDILCNNAGVFDLLTPLAECSDDLWEKVIRVNLTGPFLTTRRALSMMLEQKHGVILNTGSVASGGGGRAGAAYTASKHGVLGLTRSTAWYYRDQGIRCNAIEPGAIQTPMATEQIPHIKGYEKMASHLTSIQRFGSPEEVAKAAAFLVSDESQYINGSVLTIDGGWTLF